MSNITKNWYALYIKPGREKKVANLLSRRNIENYYPLKRQMNERKKVLLVPLINSYVFVQITDTEMVNIRRTEGVINFIYWLGKPAVIRAEEIEMMKRFMNEYTDVKLEKILFSANGMDRVTGEWLDNKENLVSVKNNSVNVALPSLGYVMIAEMRESTVEMITTAKQFYTITEKYQFAV